MAISNNKTVAKNTLMLTLRMVLVTIVGLYTTRKVLEALGVDDYGIFSLVSGITALFGFINASMSGASSRYLSYELGQPNGGKTREVFNSAVLIHVIIAFIFLLFAETVGLYIVAYKLSIPPQSHTSALWIYQFALIGACVGILQTPYNALIISKERMNIYAYVEVLNVTLKLLIVYLLMELPFDKLITYGALYLSVTILVALTYRIYCIRNFKECHLKKLTDYSAIKPMLSFSGWNLVGDIGYTLRQNGSNIILNIFFGPIVNAANGIAMTIQGVVMSFSMNAITALRPPIIKEYSAGNLIKSATMIKSGSILAAIIMTVLCAPIIINIDYILDLWLTDTPPYCADFAVLCLGAGYISCISNVLYIGLQAFAKLKTINLIRFIVYSLSLATLYLLLKLGMSPETAYYIIILALTVTTVANIIILRKYFASINPIVLCGRLLYATVVGVACYFITCQATAGFDGFARLVLSSMIYILIYLIATWLLVIDSAEKKAVNAIITGIIGKYRHGKSAKR